MDDKSVLLFFHEELFRSYKGQIYDQKRTVLVSKETSGVGLLVVEVVLVSLSLSLLLGGFFLGVVIELFFDC